MQKMQVHFLSPATAGNRNAASRAPYYRPQVTPAPAGPSFTRVKATGLSVLVSFHWSLGVVWFRLVGLSASLSRHEQTHKARLRSRTRLLYLSSRVGRRAPLPPPLPSSKAAKRPAWARRRSRSPPPRPAPKGAPAPRPLLQAPFPRRARLRRPAAARGPAEARDRGGGGGVRPGSVARHVPGALEGPVHHQRGRRGGGSGDAVRDAVRVPGVLHPVLVSASGGGRAEVSV